RADLADLGGGLTDLLLVRSLDDDLRRRGHLERDAGARLDHDGMRVADLKLEVGALERCAVADALNLEALLEALRDTLDHVRDERARQPVQRAILAALGGTRDDDGAVLLLDLHARRDLLLQGAERAGDLHAAGIDGHGHAAGDFDGSFSDST